jgi:hypothetical protein
VDALCVANRPQEAQPQPGFVESAGSGEAIANTPEMMFQMFQTWLALVSRMQTNQGEKQTENIPPLPSLAWMQLTDQFRQTPWHSKK